MSTPEPPEGLTPAGERGHRDYVLDKLAKQVELHAIRSPIEWRTELDKWSNRRELHDSFMYGRQLLLGRTPEKGWEFERVQHTPYGDRRFDTVQFLRAPGLPVRILETDEYKAGYAPAEETLLQLRKEEFLLQRGIIQRSTLTVRELEDLPREVADKAQELADRFPGRSILEVVGQAAFEQAVQAGRPIMQQHAMARMLEAIEQVRHAPELAVARDAITKFNDKLTHAREQGQPIPLGVLLGGRDDLLELIRADHQIARERDDIALKRESLPIKRALMVEEFQRQSREERTAGLQRELEPLEREIDTAALELAEASRPDLAREREQLREQALVVEREMPTAAELDLARAYREMHYRAQEIQERERDAEQLALEREGLEPIHIESVQQHLDQQREERDREITQRIERTREEVRQRENERLMTRHVEDYNRAIARTAEGTSRAMQEQGRNLELPDIAEHARSLMLPPEKARELDPRIYEAFKQGRGRFDEGRDAWMLTIEGREVQVERERPERVAAEIARQAERGIDPRAITNMYTWSQTDRPAVAHMNAERDREIERDDEARRGRIREQQREMARELEARQREQGGPSIDP